MTSIELFAGIAGFSSPAIRPLAFVEREPSCHLVLRRHHPDTLILDDVRTAGAHNLPWANVIKFGFPCQDLSVAGQRAGLAGQRSGLFYEATRIVNELRPDYAVWENVPGLLSSRGGRDFLAVLVELERIGYCGCWTTLDAQHFGVAQRRQRVFGVFARRDIGAERCAEILSLAARMSGHSQARHEARSDVAATVAASAGHHGHSSPRGGGSDNLIAQSITTGTGRRYDTSTETLIAPTIQSGENATGGTRPPGTTVDTAESLVVVSVAQNQRGELRTSPVAAQLTSGGGKPGQGYSAVLAFTERTRAEGRTLEAQEDLAYALTNPGSGGRTHSRQIAGGFGVRRLTPRECERLQGFDDDYTAWGIDADGNRVELSDSVRYRMLGNAVCKKVSAWIDARIVEALL